MKVQTVQVTNNDTNQQMITAEFQGKKNLILILILTVHNITLLNLNY